MIASFQIRPQTRPAVMIASAMSPESNMELMIGALATFRSHTNVTKYVVRNIQKTGVVMTFPCFVLYN